MNDSAVYDCLIINVHVTNFVLTPVCV